MGLILISGFFHVDRVAPDRPKSVWGVDADAWREASPATYAATVATPMLLLYADGDDSERQNESEELARLLLDAGSPQVVVTVVKDRDHLSIGSRLGEPDDPAAKTALKFIMRTDG